MERKTLHEIIGGILKLICFDTLKPWFSMLEAWRPTKD